MTCFKSAEFPKINNCVFLLSVMMINVKSVIFDVDKFVGNILAKKSHDNMSYLGNVLPDQKIVCIKDNWAYFSF